MSTEAARTVTRHVSGALIAALVMGLAGCFLQLPDPYVDLTIEPYYDSNLTLIPYSFHGEGATSYGRYTLTEWDEPAQAYLLRQTRDIQIPSGSSGVLSFELPDNRYRLSFTVLSSRDGRFTPVPFLSMERSFTVDTRAPDGWFGPDPHPDSGPFPRAYEQLVRLSHPELFQAHGAPVSIYYNVYEGSNGELPTTDSNRYEPGDTIYIWNGGVAGFAYLNVFAIDEAGNRSETVTYAYEFQP